MVREPLDDRPDDYHGSVQQLIRLDDIIDAASRIGGHVLRTPTIQSPGLRDHLGVPVEVKLELLQYTGSFKPRGAFNKILGLSEQERAVGVVAVSGGNHGVAVAEVAGLLGITAVVVMPDFAPPSSIARTRAAGATVRLTPGMPEAFALLDDLVAAGLTLVHPFDDPVVVAGQGTVGLEFAQDATDLTDVLVSIGGGGLIAGVATAFRSLAPRVRIWGVETEGATAMSQALMAGEPVPTVPTSIVSTLSAPRVSALTLQHTVDLVDEVIVVSDADAVRGSLTLAERAKVWAEPAAGCLIPAAQRVIGRVGPDVRLGLIICGGNVTIDAMNDWIVRFGARQAAAGGAVAALPTA